MADLADHANELVLARLDGLLAARPALAIRESAEDCEDCGEPIPQARRRAEPGCSRCIDCQDRHERR
ncbi:TraR/DksA C4-type zinc finger protein [Pseudomonas aeruginosa]|uniref:TraR/DksA C4-type zinc finger protein n=1 Tax=Pseudomonas aeruginosa TaxID=287 RepID=UPI0029367CD7|nr:TraR/DksA C4-type zinc finger protein [Pseudomonas aeruginosa]MDV2791093.1 TraR/DksA C4-type zinc finger protein [Pseudomonas aeruginosa]